MNKIVTNIIDLIKDNKTILDKLKKEDDEVFSFEFQVSRLLEILSKYKSKAVKKSKSKRIFVSHYGSPYITAILCIEAIFHNCEVVIGIDEICYGLNTAIVKIVNDSLKEQRIQMQISLKMNVSNSDLEAMDLDEVVCLGNSNSYMNLRKITNTVVKYVPLFDIALCYEAIEFEELVENIRNYAAQNLYEIEIFDETEDFEDVIYRINHGLPKFCAVILSKDIEKQERFKKEVGLEIVCVNENPFNKFEIKIPKEIF